MEDFEKDLHDNKHKDDFSLQNVNCKNVVETRYHEKWIDIEIDEIFPKTNSDGRCFFFFCVLDVSFVGSSRKASYMFKIPIKISIFSFSFSSVSIFPSFSLNHMLTRRTHISSR